MNNQQMKFALDGLNGIANFASLNFGAAGTDRPGRLKSWLHNVRSLCESAHPELAKMWDWCLSRANDVHSIYLVTPSMGRNHLSITDVIPQKWSFLEGRLRPKVIASVPGFVKEWVEQRAQQGNQEQLQHVLYHLLKLFHPGDANDRMNLM